MVILILTNSYIIPSMHVNGAIRSLMRLHNLVLSYISHFSSFFSSGIIWNFFPSFFLSGPMRGDRGVNLGPKGRRGPRGQKRPPPKFSRILHFPMLPGLLWTHGSSFSYKSFTLGPGMHTWHSLTQWHIWEETGLQQKLFGLWIR